MSTSLVTLPTGDPLALASLINSHVSRELVRTSYWRIMRLVYQVYLQGARHFSEFNLDRGALKFDYLDVSGNLHFKSQELLQKINQFIGYSLAGSLRPSVVRSDSSLQGVRERAVAQAIIDSVVSDQILQRFLQDFLFQFWGMGGCGVSQTIINHPTIGLSTDLQAIEPCSLFPFPSVGTDRSKASGILWRRFVPLDWLKDKLGNKLGGQQSKLRIFRIVPGQPEQDLGMQGGLADPAFQGTGFTGSPSPMNMQNGTTEMVEVREVWMDAPSGLSNRYVLQSGTAILHDEDRKNNEFYRPVRYIRCLDDGTWHGQGIADLLFPSVRANEGMVSFLEENIKSASKFDILVLPTGTLDMDSLLRDTGQGLKVACYSPDPMQEQQRPMTVRQATSGDLPGKTAAFFQSITDRLAFPEILQGGAPGRVDSAEGLQFLDQQARRALMAPIGNLQMGLGEVYRGICSDAVNAYKSAKTPIPINRLTLDMAGLQMKPGSSGVTLDANPLHDVTRLTFTTREGAPKNPAALKQEAQNYMMNKVLSPDQFLYYCIQEGLDASIPMGKARNSYEKAVRNVLLLFNDGVTPGQIIRTAQTNNPAIDGMVLEEFMQSFAFSMASPAVQDAFSSWYDDVQGQAGVVLPPGYMPPDDAAILRAAEAQAAPQQPQTAPVPS